MRASAPDHQLQKACAARLERQTKSLRTTNQKASTAQQKPICLAPSFAIACIFPLPITNSILQNAAHALLGGERVLLVRTVDIERERKALAGAETGKCKKVWCGLNGQNEQPGADVPMQRRSLLSLWRSHRR